MSLKKVCQLVTLGGLLVAYEAMEAVVRLQKTVRFLIATANRHEIAPPRNPKK